MRFHAYTLQSSVKGYAVFLLNQSIYGHSRHFYIDLLKVVLSLSKKVIVSPVPYHIEQLVE